MKKTFTVLMVLMGLILTAPTFSQNNSIIPQALYQPYVSFQTNADIVRLKHLVYWGQLIDEYHQKTGHYPFANQSRHPIYVEIATPQQQSYFKDIKPPAPATTKSMKEFVKELEKGLGRGIQEYYDPQYAPDGKPNFYIYMIDQSQYHLAVHTFSDYPFSRKIAENYYKVEISNQPNQKSNIFSLGDLLQNQAFQQSINQPIEKADFFKERERKTLSISKE